MYFVCQIFTGIFALEALIKIVAFGLLDYLKDRWNCFDLTIVTFSLVELGLRNVKGLSILRTFRLVCSLFLIQLIRYPFMMYYTLRSS